MTKKHYEAIAKIFSNEYTSAEKHNKPELDASKFVTERLGKEHYSTRKELTDKGGKRLFNVKDKEADETLVDLFKGVEAPKSP